MGLFLSAAVGKDNIYILPGKVKREGQRLEFFDELARSSKNLPKRVQNWLRSDKEKGMWTQVIP